MYCLAVLLVLNHAPPPGTGKRACIVAYTSVCHAASRPLTCCFVKILCVVRSMFSVLFPLIHPWLTSFLIFPFLPCSSLRLLPILYEFNPDLIIVSAGFDAAAGDPLGGCRVTPACYGHMTALLQPIAPICLLLEGGYNLAVTAVSVEACVRVLLGEAPQRLRGPLIPTAVGLAGITKALGVHSRWVCRSAYLGLGLYCADHCGRSNRCCK